ncbi:hypothetical protein [Mycolicibacterium farcinogenes]|uniref:hypothetical protein n=1 Tax=Mycolicibacterium farcinogenes TaxID=1802 RepID=UPI0021AE2D78|nr:hypothetical protein [Mycolicibacterium farcinogenes]
MTSTPPHSSDPWDDDDEGYQDNVSELDGLPDYSDYAQVAEDSDDDWLTDVEAGLSTTGQDDDSVETLLVTAASPSGVVTATSLLGGQVIRVKLSSQATKMSESELADEIVAISTLACRQAAATQHYLIATLMNRLGQDPASTSSLLEHTIGLPSPKTVLNEKARMFAEYYSDRD